MNGQELLSELTTSAIVIYVLQWLKQTQAVTWITEETKTLNRWLMLAGSGLGAIGIHFAFDATAGSLVITGLTLTGVGHGLWHWLNSAALTQLAYDAAVAKPKAQTLTVQTASLP